MKPFLYMIVPVLNESGNLTRLFTAFRTVNEQFKSDYQVQFIMVNDGSTDGTGELAQQLSSELDFVLLCHHVNQGPGKAFGTAFSYLASRLNETDWVVTLEGDNTSRHELLGVMLRRASEENYDAVLASPYMYGGGLINTSTWRLVLSAGANLLVKEMLGIQGILTSSSFYRVYRASLIQKLQTYYGAAILERAGFECMLEMLMKMIFLQTTISEVPMVLDTQARVGKSKMKILRTIIGYMMLWRRKKGWYATASSTIGLRVQPSP